MSHVSSRDTTLRDHLLRILKRYVSAVSATMDMTADSHRSWYDGTGRDETDSQLSVAEHMSSLFAHHHASLDSQSRDYHHRTVTVTSRYYQHQLQHSPYASHGEFLHANYICIRPLFQQKPWKCFVFKIFFPLSIRYVLKL